MQGLREQPAAAFPGDPGTYALILHLVRRREITVGRLGIFPFPGGTYVYVGSALGPGGLAGRLRHHTRPTTTPGWQATWHVDYLRRYAKIEAVAFIRDDIRREHHWAAALSQLHGAIIPASKFGASDCRCPSHLFHLSGMPGEFMLNKIAAVLVPGAALKCLQTRRR